MLSGLDEATDKHHRYCLRFNPTVLGKPPKKGSWVGAFALEVNFGHRLVKMAGNLVPLGQLSKLRLIHRATVHDEGTPGMEVTSGRWVQRGGHLAAQDQVFSL